MKMMKKTLMTAMTIMISMIDERCFIVILQR